MMLRSDQFQHAVMNDFNRHSRRRGAGHRLENDGLFLFDAMLPISILPRCTQSKAFADRMVLPSSSHSHDVKLNLTFMIMSILKQKGLWGAGGAPGLAASMDRGRSAKTAEAPALTTPVGRCATALEVPGNADALTLPGTDRFWPGR